MASWLQGLFLPVRLDRRSSRIWRASSAPSDGNKRGGGRLRSRGGNGQLHPFMRSQGSITALWSPHDDQGGSTTCPSQFSAQPQSRSPHRDGYWINGRLVCANQMRAVTWTKAPTWHGHLFNGRVCFRLLLHVHHSCKGWARCPIWNQPPRASSLGY
jgi:hypothetical protein